ncbi:DUF3857 and transglutaminase domain-containing protein [Catenovulum sediminis]|uniref:DUF3857 and transglutaminase domain-containing protein n=1 Tax=Catenovulum sediminis TaxID=1740262 RepID=UPI0011816999|nr:DUF3857 and transglutaminase domain-containing protein [Catenovulum sediminis]
MLKRLFFCLLMLVVTLVNSYATERLAPELTQQQQLVSKSISAETLYAVNHSTLNEDGHWQRVSYYSIRINDLAAARDYGRIVIPFNHYYSEMQLDFANSYSAQGKLNALADDALQRRITGGGQDFYSDSSELVFSLPEVNPGTIIEFQFTQISKKLAFPKLYTERSTPYWFQGKVAQDSWRADYVHNYEFQFTYPQSQQIYTRYFNQHPKAEVIASLNGWNTKRWQMKDVPEMVIERRMPSGHEVRPQMMLSTLKDWSAVDAWTWAKVVDKLQPSTALQLAIASLGLNEFATDEEKVRAVYRYLQTKIRYVFAHLGRGGYDPHKPEKVIEAGYGDCKDQTVLAVAMLRALGIEAYPALVETPRNGNSDTQVVRLIFDHMVVYIPATSERSEIWLDTTGDRGLYPGMSNYMVGQNALIVDGEGGQLIDIAEESFATNKAQLNIHYYQDESGASKASLSIELSGMFEQHIRSWWKHSSEQAVALQQFVKGLYSQGLDFSVDAQVHNSESLDTPVSITADYHFSESPDNNELVRAASVMQVLGLFADFSNLPMPAERVHRYVEKYPYHLSMRVKVEDGKQTIASLIQNAQAVDATHFNLQQSAKRLEDGVLLSIDFTHPELDLTLEEYQEYHNHISKLAKQEVWLVSLRVDPEKDKIAELSKVAAEQGKNSLQAYLLTARQLIEKGEFSAAIEPARKAIELDNNSGEAWYLLATAQGFATQVEASLKSFAKAEELGYQP